MTDNDKRVKVKQETILEVFLVSHWDDLGLDRSQADVLRQIVMDDESPSHELLSTAIAESTLDHDSAMSLIEKHKTHLKDWDRRDVEAIRNGEVIMLSVKGVWVTYTYTGTATRYKEDVVVYGLPAKIAGGLLSELFYDGPEERDQDKATIVDKFIKDCDLIAKSTGKVSEYVILTCPRDLVIEKVALRIGYLGPVLKKYCSDSKDTIDVIVFETDGHFKTLDEIAKYIKTDDK